MDLHTWLDKPENKGKALALSERLGLSKASVSLWRESGVPLVHMQAVYEFSNGAVTVPSMVAHAAACRAAKASERAKAA